MKKNIQAIGNKVDQKSPGVMLDFNYQLDTITWVDSLSEGLPTSDWSVCRKLS